MASTWYQGASHRRRVALEGTCSRATPCQRAATAPSPTAWTRPHIQVQDPKALYRLHLPAPAPKQEPPTKGTAPGLDRQLVGTCAAVDLQQVRRGYGVYSTARKERPSDQRYARWECKRPTGK